MELMEEERIQLIQSEGLCLWKMVIAAKRNKGVNIILCAKELKEKLMVNPVREHLECGL